MARTKPPRTKVVRALGVDLPGLTRRSSSARPQPPGQHGRRQRRASEYREQLQEKQKLRFNYGLTERQLRKLFMEARRAKGNVGSTLITLLERRLDNVVFRAGFAPTIPAARQLVLHGHVRVNGRRVTIPSFRVRPGDVIRPAPASARLPIVAGTLAEPALQRPDWIALDPVTLEARLTHIPSGNAAPFPVEMQRVVEYYTKRT